MKHKVALLYLFLFIVIGVVSVVILHHTKKESENSAQENRIGTFVHDATFTEYNEQGLIKTKTHAEKVIHYLPQGTTLFKNPFIITYTESRTPWHIRADQAVSDRTGEKIILTGNVVAHELPTAQQPGTTIKTTEITVFPKESRMETNKPILLMRPGMIIHGTGLTANLKTGQYQLHPGSKAIYTPEKNSKKKSSHKT